MSQYTFQHAPRPYALVAALLLASALSACSSGSSSSEGSTQPRLSGVNAVSDLPGVTFLREEEVWSALEFGTATEFRSIDSDQYDFSFDALLPGDETTICQGDIDRDDFKDDNECTRLVSESINVIDDHEYVAALVGTYGNFRVNVYDKLIHEFDTQGTDDDGDPEDENTEVQVFHWGEQLGPMDVYIEPPGTNLSAVQVRATLSIDQEFHDLIDEGQYVLSLTAVGDPNSPLYTSETFSLSRQTRVAIAILDGTFDATSSIRVTRFRDQGGDLLDRRVDTLLRLVHASASAGTVDMYAEEDFTTPVVTSFDIGQSTDYAVVDSTALSSYQLDVTPAGNVGALLARDQIRLTRGTRNSFYLVDTEGANLDGLHVLDRFRRLAPYAELRMVNSTGKSIDIYVIPHGNNVYSSNTTETLSTGSSGAIHTFEPGSYDIWLAEANTDLYMLGPLTVELEGSGIFTVVAIATTDATRADVVLLDDFAQ